MKTKLFAVLLIVMMSLSACSSSDTASSEDEITANDLLSILDYDLDEYVTLPEDYENMKIDLDPSDYEVTDDLVQEYIEEYVLYSFPEYIETDKTTVENGDVVNIDFVGTIDGEEFDNGSATGYDLVIGSGTFIEGFEEDLIGASVGETIEINETFPEDYSEEDLAGKTAVFTVTINDIKEEHFLTFDELTDDFVVENFADSEITTVDELQENERTYLEQQMENELIAELDEEVLEYLIEHSTFNYPDSALEQMKNELIKSVESGAEEEGMEYEDYVSGYFGYDDMDEFDAYVDETAVYSLKQELVADAVLQDRQTVITKEEFETFMESYMEYYEFSDIEEVYDLYGGEKEVELSYAASKSVDDLAAEIRERL